MANATNPNLKGAALRGEVDLTTDAVKVVALDNTYSIDFGADQFLADIDSEAIVATSLTLTTPTVSDGGVFDADNATFEEVGIGENAIKQLGVFIDTTVAATSLLLARIDTMARGMPVDATPNGEDITIVWPDEGIFSL